MTESQSRGRCPTHTPPVEEGVMGGY